MKKVSLSLLFSIMTFTSIHAEREWGKMSDIDDNGGSSWIIFAIIFLIGIVKVIFDSRKK
jgi:hypothetical protein